MWSYLMNEVWSRGVVMLWSYAVGGVWSCGIVEL